MKKTRSPWLRASIYEQDIEQENGRKLWIFHMLKGAVRWTVIASGAQSSAEQWFYERQGQWTLRSLSNPSLILNYDVLSQAQSTRLESVALINRLAATSRALRSLKGIVKQRADSTIRYIKNGVFKKVALFEDKRRGYETQTAVWVDTLEQLINSIQYL